MAVLGQPPLDLLDGRDSPGTERLDHEAGRAAREDAGAERVAAAAQLDQERGRERVAGAGRLDLASGEGRVIAALAIEVEGAAPAAAGHDQQREAPSQQVDRRLI